MAREFIVPGRMITGSGALDMAETALGSLGKKAMIVTDQVMIQLGNCAKVETALKNQGGFFDTRRYPRYHEPIKRLWRYTL